MKYSEDFYDTPYTPFRLHVSRPNYYRLIFSHQQLCRSIQFRPSPDCHSQVSNVISISGNILGIRRMLARISFVLLRVLYVLFSIVYIFRIHFFHRFSCHPLFLSCAQKIRHCFCFNLLNVATPLLISFFRLPVIFITIVLYNIALNGITFPRFFNATFPSLYSILSFIISGHCPFIVRNHSKSCKIRILFMNIYTSSLNENSRSVLYSPSYIHANVPAVGSINRYCYSI